MAKLQRTTYCREIEASARLNLPGMLTCWCRAVKKDVELAVGGWDIIWVDKKQVLILYLKESLNSNQFFSEIAGHPP